MTGLEERARHFADVAHTSINQRRKWTNEPYVVHPIAVAEIVRGVRHDKAMIAAALLHDVVEDTPVTIGEIRETFGWDVAELVAWLTKPAAPPGRSRAERVARAIEHSAAAPARAQTIKLADVIDNCLSVARLAPDFAARYLPEKAALVEALSLADPELIALARETIGTYI